MADNALILDGGVGAPILDFEESNERLIVSCTVGNHLQEWKDPMDIVQSRV